ncbi:MAG: alpha/beta hydrolase [Myxococcota bacterium]
MVHTFLRSSPPALRSLRVLLALVLGVFGLLGSACQTTGLAYAELDYPEPLAQTQTVQVGSVSVAYADQGQGDQTLLLIHGLGSYMPVWTYNVSALARDYRVVAIDLPGYGKSSKDNDYSYSMAFFAEVVQGVIDELALGHPVIVGHSMGSQIAITHALRYPGSARALVLTSPAGMETFEDGEAKWLADAVTDDFTCKTPPDAVYGRYANNFYRMPKEARFMVAHRVAVIGGPDFPQYCRAVSRSVRAMLDEPVYEQLPELEVPALVLFARQDGLIPNPFLHGGSTERLARRTIEQMPDAELVILKKAGHMAQFERAEEWNEAVLGFLSRLPPVEGAAEEAAEASDEAAPDSAPEPAADEQGSTESPEEPIQSTDVEADGQADEEAADSSSKTAGKPKGADSSDAGAGEAAADGGSEAGDASPDDATSENPNDATAGVSEKE